MPLWPFTSHAPGNSTPIPNDSRLQRRLHAFRDAIPRPLVTYFEEQPYVPLVVVGIAVGLGGSRFYSSYIQRIPQASNIPTKSLRKRVYHAKVTRVGDGDGFHAYHTPGGRLLGWHWARKVPTNPQKLKDQTISVRLAGVDAPEMAHNWDPKDTTDQPGAREALDWLKQRLLHQGVRIVFHKIDQHGRAVGTAYMRREVLDVSKGIGQWWRTLWDPDVGLEMLRIGLATVYEAKTGAEFGGREAKYRKVEAQAKRKKKGIWGLAGFTSPAKWKKGERPS